MRPSSQLGPGNGIHGGDYGGILVFFCQKSMVWTNPEKLNSFAFLIANMIYCFAHMFIIYSGEDGGSYPDRGP